MRFGISVTFTLMMGQTLFAQQAVQQPVLGVTSVNTSVLVPDRGSIYLGGVSSAQSGRSQYGPLRSGTSMGLMRQSTSISTSVYIIDLNEMDRALLNSRPVTSENLQSGIGNLANRPLPESRPVAGVTSAERASRFEEMARRAEKAGKTNVAKMHWQYAADYGSKLAEKRLFELTKPTPSPDQPAQSGSR